MLTQVLRLNIKTMQAIQVEKCTQLVLTDPVDPIVSRYRRRTTTCVDTQMEITGVVMVVGRKVSAKLVRMAVLISSWLMLGRNPHGIKSPQSEADWLSIRNNAKIK